MAHLMPNLGGCSTEYMETLLFCTVYTESPATCWFTLVEKNPEY